MKKFAKYEHRRLRLMASCCQGDSVLDLGYAQLPNPYFIGLHRTGLDINKPVPNLSGGRTQVNYDENIVGDVAAAQDIFSGRRFDNIVAGELIEHLENPYEFLRNLRPLLTESGQLILSTPNPLSFPVVFFEYARSKQFFYTFDHKYYFPPRWVERMLELCGYSVVQVKGVGFWNPFIHIPVASSISYQVIYVATPRRQE